MFLNVVFMVIVASVLASIFVIYMDLKDSVLAAYSTISLASLYNWLVKKNHYGDHDRSTTGHFVVYHCRNNFHSPLYRRSNCF